MARRAGRIIPKGERKWLVRWCLGQDEKTGKYLYKAKTVHGIKRDAQAFLNQILRSRDLGTYVEPTKLTLNSYLDRWLKSAGSALAERTLDDYTRLLARYIRPKLGTARLDALRPLHLQEIYDAMERAGLGARTIRMAHAPLRQALEQAVRWRLLAENPARGVKLPKGRSKERRALSQDEVQRFRAAAAGTRFATLWELMLLTGLRPAEALALRWQDLDLEDHQLSVRQSLQRVRPGCWEIRPPKTEKSKRTVPLSPRLTKALRAHRSEQHQQRLERRPTPLPYRDLDLVFATAQGGTLDPNNVAFRHFRPIVEAAQLGEGITPYSLRHTCATLSLAAGVSVLVVAERLGHTSPKMTLDVYGHVLEGQQADATATLEAVLSAS